MILACELAAWAAVCRIAITTSLYFDGMKVKLIQLAHASMTASTNVKPSCLEEISTRRTAEWNTILQTPHMIDCFLADTLKKKLGARYVPPLVASAQRFHSACSIEVTCRAIIYTTNNHCIESRENYIFVLAHETLWNEFLRHPLDHWNIALHCTVSN